MITLPRFAVHRPDSLAEATGLAEEFGDDASFYAGGTELLLAMRMGVMRPEHLVDLKRVPGLDTLALSDGGRVLTIGSAVKHRTLEYSPMVREHVPQLATTSSRIGNARVRASGTWGGNLAFAEPRSDVATIALCLDAVCQVYGPAGARRQELSDLIVGPYETTLAPSEVLVSAEVRVPGPGAYLSYEKFQIQERPAIGVGVLLETDGEQIRDCRMRSARRFRSRCAHAKQNEPSSVICTRRTTGWTMSSRVPRGDGDRVRPGGERRLQRAPHRGPPPPCGGGAEQTSARRIGCLRGQPSCRRPGCNGDQWLRRES